MPNKYQLRLLFWSLLQLAGQYRDKVYGDPCSYLLEQMMLYQEEFLNMFVKAPDTCCDSHEIRLNGAGLKLLWMNYKGRLWMDIAGDQKDLYPDFVPRADQALRMAGFKSMNDQE